MTNTPENRHAFETMARLANALNTGYQVFSRVTDNGKYVILDMYCPGDTEEIAYPTVYFCDAFVDEAGISFEIVPGIYRDHDLAQTNRIMNGLGVAMKLVEVLYAAAKVYGIPTTRNPA